MWQALDWGQDWATDLNTITVNGLHSFQSSTATHMPDGFSGVGVLLHVKQTHGGGAYGFQLAFGLNNDKMYKRESTGDVLWNAWKEIYDNSLLTNSTMLGQLANALGVMQNKNIPQEKDLNNIFDIGFYIIQIDDGTYINKPVGANNYGTLVVFECGNYTLQVWINDSIGSKMFIRGNWAHGNWYGWREIALTAQ